MSELVENLRMVAKLRLGDPFPAGWSNWAAELSKIAGEAATEIERLQCEATEANSPIKLALLYYKTETSRLKQTVASQNLQIEQLHARLTCMCGSWVEGHDDMESGHSPVPMYDYALDQATAELKKLYTALQFWVIARFPEQPIDASTSQSTIAQIQQALRIAENTLRTLSDAHQMTSSPPKEKI